METESIIEWRGKREGRVRGTPSTSESKEYESAVFDSKTRVNPNSYVPEASRTLLLNFNIYCLDNKAEENRLRRCYNADDVYN